MFKRLKKDSRTQALREKKQSIDYQKHKSQKKTNKMRTLGRWHTRCLHIINFTSFFIPPYFHHPRCRHSPAQAPSCKRSTARSSTTRHATTRSVCIPPHFPLFDASRIFCYTITRGLCISRKLCVNTLPPVFNQPNRGLLLPEQQGHLEGPTGVLPRTDGEEPVLPVPCGVGLEELLHDCVVAA